MTNKKMNISILLIYIFAMIGISFIQLGIKQFTPQLIDTDSEINSMSSILNLLTYGFIFFAFVFTFKNYFKKYIQFSLNHKREILFYILISGLLIMTMTYISSTFMNILNETNVPENQETWNNLADGSLFNKITFVLIAVCFAPLVEEMVYRKAIYGLFSRINPVVAIIGSGLVFGYVHVLSDDLIQIMYYALLGIVLGYIYFLSNKNIIVPIVVHALFNLFVTITMFSM